MVPKGEEIVMHCSVMQNAKCKRKASWIKPREKQRGSRGEEKKIQEWEEIVDR